MCVAQKHLCCKGELQLNFGGIGVKLRMKERRIEEGIHEDQLSIR